MSQLAWLLLLASASGCGPGAITDANDVLTSGSAANAVDLDAECPLVDDIESLDTSPPSLYRESIQRADEGIRELETLWPPTALLLERLRGSLGSYERQYGEDSSLGFDAYRTTELVSKEGYVWCLVEAVMFRSELAMAKASCYWHGERDVRRQACLLRRYGARLSALGLTVEGTKATARSEFLEVLARMHRARLAQLVGPDDGAAAQPDQLSGAEELLSDPLARLAVGRMGGRGSVGEKTDYRAARSLVDAKDVAALRRVLRGPNPEGRAFAALGLRHLGALSPKDLRVVELLKETSTVLSRSGCMGEVTPAREFYGRLDSFDSLFER